MYNLVFNIFLGLLFILWFKNTHIVNDVNIWTNASNNDDMMSLHANFVEL